MPVDALIVMTTTWGLGALAVLATHYASLNLKRLPRQHRRNTLGTAALCMVWIVVTGLLGASGWLSDFTKVPPPFLVYVTACGLLTLSVAFSPLGTLLIQGLTFPMLIGFQAFRILAELMLYAGHLAGRVPVQMTFAGWNFDILTGISAIGMAWWLHSKKKRIDANARDTILSWNIAGLFLLLVIILISVLSTPAFRFFPTEPANTFVTSFPYIWLPCVLVQFALLGHLLCFRKLWYTREPE